MSFLNPVFLWALSGIGLPLLIHFLGKRSKKVIPFSYIKILELTRRQTLKIEKIQEILIILFRTILIFFILLVLSEPLSNSPIFKKEKKYVVFIIDNSMSMLANNGYGIEKTKKIISKILNNLDKKTEISLVFLNGKFYNFQNDFSKIRDIINNENLFYFSGDFGWAFDKSKEILKNKEGEKMVFIFSDLQKKAFQNIDKEFKGVNIFIFDVSSENRENLSIKSVYPSNKKNCYIVDIVNWGHSKKEFVLSVKNNMGKIKEEKLNINSEENKKYEIEITPESKNFIFEIETDDAILPDNIYFLPQGEKEKNILLVSGDEISSKFLINAFEALKPFYEINFKVVKINEIEKIYLPEYQLIILNDTGMLKKEVIKLIYSYLKEAGNVILFIGDRTLPEVFNETWEIKEEKINLQPCKIEKTVVESEKPLDITYIEKKEPVFYDFGEKIYEYLSPVKFWKYYKIKENYGVSFLKIDGNFDIMIKKNVGTGNIIFFPFVLKDNWTNFQHKPFFPVFLSKLIEKYAKDTNLNFIIGDPQKLNIPGDTEKIEIYQPDGNIFKIVSKNEDFEFNPEIPGFWKIKFYKGNEKIERGIGVNPDYNEGNLEKISIKELKGGFHGNLKIINEEKFEKFEERFFKSKDLTDFLLSIAFIFLFLNIIFSEIVKFK
jgi:hypothetical protein